MKFIGLFTFLFFLSSPVLSQNTKGDKPVKNQRQVRETRGKSVKRKEKGATKDIAGRRLRTKNQSSANRANAGYRQPNPSSGRAKKSPDRAASPRGRVFDKSPRETKTRAWRGDISGYRIKRVKPGGSDAARNNVYPQKGPYVRYARKRPKEKPPVYGRTIKGTKFIRHQPRSQERAWKGGLDKGPIKNQSATGSVKNVYPQKGPYVAYYKKRSGGKERAVSNRTELSQVKRYSKQPKTGGSQPRFYPGSGSKSYVQRGRKNVYWGKVQKKERGVTTDITGGPLRTRNYKSPVAGLVGRDTLKFFGRKPVGDRSNRAGSGGPISATRKGQKGWNGDISGFKLRKSAGRKTIAGIPIPGTGQRTRSRRGDQAELNSPMAIVYGRDLSGNVKKGKRPPAEGGGSIRAFWNNQGNPISGRGPGAGYMSAGKFSGNFKQGQLRPGFSQEGTGYSGNQNRSKQRGFSQQGFGFAGNLKGNQQRGFNQQGARYSGNVKRSSLSEFSPSGFGYSGFMNRSQVSGFSSASANYSGNVKRGSLSEFSSAGANYSGNIKRGQSSGFSKQGADYSGNQKSGKGFRGDYIGYSGNINSASTTEFSRAGANYSGSIKRIREPKLGGSISGAVWNNKNRSVSRASITPLAAQTAAFSGDIVRVGPVKQFNENGVAYTGFMPRGGKGFGEQGANFSGRSKYKRPDKGGGSVSGILWNNKETSLPKDFQGAPGAGFSGRNKYKKPEKGGGSVSGLLWNNKESTLPKTLPSGMASTDYTGRIAVRKSPVQNPNAAKASNMKSRPDRTAFMVAGLQVKVKEQNYSRNSHANKDSRPGIAPKQSSVKASEYSRNMKQYWDYKHNPSSSPSALKTIGPGKAAGRIRDFQGNVKMHKYSGSRLHPDAQFAHGEDDNVPGEKSFFTNVKLFWSRMFHKNDTQPENLKEKSKKPQYDKREKGLWAY